MGAADAIARAERALADARALLAEQGDDCPYLLLARVRDLTVLAGAATALARAGQVLEASGAS